MRKLLTEYKCDLCNYISGENHKICPACQNGEGNAWTTKKVVK